MESDASRVAAHWREMAPTLLARGIHGGGGSANFEFVSNADQSGPVNSGLFIVRPSESTYAAGMHELTKCSFNWTHGFDLVGRPHSLSLQPRHPDGSVALGMTDDLGYGNFPMLNNAFSRDRWEFVVGAAGLEPGECEPSAPTR